MNFVHTQTTDIQPENLLGRGFSEPKRSIGYTLIKKFTACNGATLNLCVASQNRYI